MLPSHKKDKLMPCQQHSCTCIITKRTNTPNNTHPYHKCPMMLKKTQEKRAFLFASLPQRWGDCMGACLFVYLKSLFSVRSQFQFGPTLLYVCFWVTKCTYFMNMDSQGRRADGRWMQRQMWRMQGKDSEDQLTIQKINAWKGGAAMRARGCMNIHLRFAILEKAQF